MALLDSAPLEAAVRDLREALASDSTSPQWRRQLRRRLARVTQALTEEAREDPGSGGGEAWLQGREVTSNRCRRQLQARVAVLSAGVLQRLDAETLTVELQRLQTDLEHHVQRLHDLVYDSVALELGGSD